MIQAIEKSILGKSVSIAQSFNLNIILINHTHLGGTAWLGFKIMKLFDIARNNEKWQFDIL